MAGIPSLVPLTRDLSMGCIADTVGCCDFEENSERLLNNVFFWIATPLLPSLFSLAEFPNPLRLRW